MYSTYLGGSAYDDALDVAVDALGQATVVGYTGSTDFPRVNALRRPGVPPWDDAFVARLSASGRALRFSMRIGGSGNDFGTGVALGPRGLVHMSGMVDSSDFPQVRSLQADGWGRDAFGLVLSPACASLRRPCGRRLLR